ncbi:beta-ketoacyl synthase N-terminal-like domain-containing protein [Streptomyces sp. NPDC057411]|uniref:beta-ketoacyl synthase N-terminal-like domain-containing protein n=1 Tax=unclassified Streptomyces TaxID=2593676 RepID=UPI00362C8B53
MSAVDRRIAVIGLTCRFPDADGPEAFWRNLLEGRDSITRVSGPDGVAARGLLDDPEWFDAGYFGISPREARIVNPQARLFLECAVAALEDAGQDPGRISGAVGVYGGGGENAYAQLLRAHRAELPSVSDWEIRVANGPDFLCSRVAHRLGLTGPTVAVQAACATSLVAVHLAVQGLLSGDCDLALAGGVTVRLPTGVGGTDEVGIQAPDGVLRAFDAAASGLVGGDGVGVVVLKRFADAEADGDRVDAVILGSAVNNDGADRMGFTAPGIAGQAAVITRAQRVAGVTPDSCTYVETHGTGTRLGDPVEVAALTKAFRSEGNEGADRPGFCGIGSVKTNIGHTDAAAGVAGLIKTVLALKHGVIPPSLHFTEPNPEIDFGAGPFRVVASAEEWRPEGMPRRAGVSSFSVGGTNAHVVLEQPPAATAEPAGAPSAGGPYVLPLSAKTPTALEAVTARLADRLRADPGIPLADVAWTLQTGRRELPYRRFALVHDAVDAVRVLAGEEPERLVTAPGAVWPGAGAPEPQGEDPAAAGRLWLTGAAVDWAALHRGRRPRKVALPTYPFERQLFTVGRDARPTAPTPPAPTTGPTPTTTPTPTATGTAAPAPTTVASAAGTSAATGTAAPTPTATGTDATASTPTSAGSPPPAPYADVTPPSAPAPYAGIATDGPPPTYEVVAKLFAEILDLPEVDPDESFFDLGGDSLIATRLVARVRETYPVELAPKELITAPTAEEFAALIEARLDRDRTP